jgi:hypothetical protein
MTMSFMDSSNRMPSQIIGYVLYVNFIGISFRNTAKALSFKNNKNKSFIHLEMDLKVQTK